MYPTPFATPGVQAFAEAVDAERQAQLAKWGDQRHPDGTGLPHSRAAADNARAACQQAFAEGRGTWAHILTEEFFEAMAESDPVKLRAELVQISAVCAAEIADLDQRPAPAELAACSAGLLPMGSDPVVPCVVTEPHESHRAADGRTWTDADGGTA
jgi:hypothetical protein